MPQILHFDNWELDRERMVAEFFSATSKDGEIRRTDGRIINYSSIPLPDGGRMVTFQDVTDTANIKRLYEIKRSSQTTERLKLDFIANVSYQLRTPAQCYYQFNEILDKEFTGPLNLRQKEYTKRPIEHLNAFYINQRYS